MNDARRRAFTLIEVVLAMALSLVLVLCVQGLVVHVTRSGAELSAQADRDAAQGAALDLMEFDLAALPTCGDLRLDGNSLQFTSLHSMHSGPERARHAVTVRYAATPAKEDGTTELVRQESELGSAITEDAGVAVAEDLQAVEFAVFDGRRWHTRWPLASQQPARALRAVIRWTNGRELSRVIRLAPIRWRRHDEPA